MSDSSATFTGLWGLFIVCWICVHILQLLHYRLPSGVYACYRSIKPRRSAVSTVAEFLLNLTPSYILYSESCISSQVMTAKLRTVVTCNAEFIVGLSFFCTENLCKRRPTFLPKRAQSGLSPALLRLHRLATVDCSDE